MSVESHEAKPIDHLGDWRRTHTCGELRASDVGAEVTIMGWVHRSRDHGGVAFADIRDRHGLTQVVVRETDNAALAEKANDFRSEYVVAVKGRVEARPPEMKNPKLATGEIEVSVSDLRILNRSLPPPFMVMMAALIGSATWAAFSRAGTAVLERHGYAALIGLQVFRLPLELAMHHASDLGVMPSVMSYSGRNFDIVTGISALVLLPLLLKCRLPLSVIWSWNVLGFALLLNVMMVAIRATPVFGHFGEAQLNTWVAYVPFVWLPSVLVTVAWAGHLLVFRKLLRQLGRQVDDPR